MTDTPRCEPSPEWRGRNWHELRRINHRGEEEVALARWLTRSNAPPLWWIDGRFLMADDAAGIGWRYIAPVTPHAEVEALRAGLEQWQGIAGLAANDIVALRARVARLEEVAKIAAETFERYAALHEARRTEDGHAKAAANAALAHRMRGALERKS